MREHLQGGIVAPRFWSGLLPGREGRAPTKLAASDSVADAQRQFRAQKFFGSLDGLRAASILAVIWHHCGAGDGLGGLWMQGNKGVTLFFVISGFLIVTLLLRMKERNGAFSVARFWGRRMCRIFPVYYAVLLAYTVGVVWV
jgi:peptidoglycan/LPS O-acetylase OafA/YrhL